MQTPVVLYEDNHLLVVEKPVNVPVQADISGDLDLLSICKAYIKQKYNKPGEVFLGLVHRLDRPVGGVMVFARTGKAAARLTAQFKGHGARKRYAAVVEGSALCTDQLTDYMVKDETTHSSAVVSKDTPGAKKAMLRYTTLARQNGTSLVDVELYTGRAHQIRVQMMHAGHPLLNDQRYNPAARPGAQIALWAYALTIQHPTLNESMTFFSAPKGPGYRGYEAQTALLPAFDLCSGVHMDEDLLVVDKRPGAEVETDLTAALSAAVGEVFPVHRLDAKTMGLVAFARNEQTEERLQTAFADHAGIDKVYHAILAGIPADREGTLVHTLLKNEEESFVRIVPEGTPGGRTARLSYKILKTKEGLALCEIRLFTGRTHQIRVQMAALGCPVLGDDKYGDRELNRRYRCKDQQLLAKKLTIGEQTFVSCRELSFPARRDEE